MPNSVRLCQISLFCAMVCSTSALAQVTQNNGVNTQMPVELAQQNMGGIFRLFMPFTTDPVDKLQPHKRKTFQKFAPTQETVGSIDVAHKADNAETSNDLDGNVTDFPMRGLIDDAVGSSDALKASRVEVEIANTNIWKQLANFTPTVGLSWDVGRIGEGLDTAINGEETNEASFTLNLPLFTSGKRLFSLKAARSSQRAALSQANVVRNEVAGQALQAYLQYMQAVETVALLGQNVTSLQRLTTAVSARKNNGFASASDVSFVRANLTNAKRQQESAIGNRNQLRAQLESLTNKPLGDLPDLPSIQKLISDDEEQLVGLAIASNPNIRAARHRATAQQHTSRASVGDYLPQVNLYGQYDVALNDYSKSQQTNDWQVGVKLTMPIIDIGTAAGIAESRQRAQLASYQASDTRRNVELNVRSLVREHQSSKRQYNLANQRVSYLKNVTVSEEQRYKKGVGSLDRVLEQRQSLAQARIDALNAKITVYWTAYQLQIETGEFDKRAYGF